MALFHFTKESFQKEVLDRKGVALVDFWATWCGPCQMFGPIIESFADEIGDDAVVGKVDIDEETELRDRYGVETIPTVIVFKDGKEVQRVVGVQSKPAMRKMIEDNA